MNHDHKFKRYDLPAGGYTEQCVVCGEYLPTVVDRLTSDKARLAVDYANTVRANAEVANINCDLNDRIKTLETALREIASIRCVSIIPCDTPQITYAGEQRVKLCVTCIARVALATSETKGE